jgi:hypothetical protein
MTTCNLSIVLALSTLRIDGLLLYSSENTPWTISTDNVLRTYTSTLACSCDLTRLTNNRE